MNNDFRDPQFQEDEIDVWKILNLILDYWWLFAISVSIGLIISYSYIWFSPPIYHATTTVLVEDSGNDISQSILDQVGVGGKKRNIENEIAILHSRTMMYEAIKSLDINTNYKVDLGLRLRDLYQNTPIKLVYLSDDNAHINFDMYVSISSTDDSATLTTVVIAPDGTETQEIQTIELGTPFKTMVGSFTLEKTDHFNKMVRGDSALSLDYELHHRTTDDIVTHYLTKLQVGEAREKASILRLNLEDVIPQRAVDVLDALLDAFIQSNIKKKNQLASNSLQFIDSQLDLVTKDLQALESDIRTFKTDNSISDVGSEATYFLEQVGSIDHSISQLDVRLSVINYLQDYIDQEKDLRNASPSSLGLEDPLLNQLISRLSELNAERESLLRFTKAENPMIAAIDTKISETKAALAKNIESIKQGLTASKAEFNKQLKKVEEKVKTLPKAEYELLALQRQYSIKESLYLLLLEKKSENSILLASTVSDNMVIDQARSKSDPIKPNKNLVFVLGFIISMGLPSLFIVLLLMLDNRIKDVDDLKKATPIPILGFIPHHNENAYLVVKHSAISAIAESFRSARTNLSFLIRSTDHDVHRGKVVQLTSTVGSEGKSFCSVNLAASLALTGQKVVVVGLDLRKPKLAEYFQFSNAIGVSSVLAEIEPLDAAIIPSGTENLDVLVGGPIPPNPSELLTGTQLAELIKELSERYDYVVLDCPPIGLVADSLIIADHVDTVVYIVRQNVTDKSGLTFINELYLTKKLQSVSILFNDLKQSKLGANTGYGYGYYSSYAEQSKPTSLLGRFKHLIGRS